MEVFVWTFTLLYVLFPCVCGSEVRVNLSKVVGSTLTFPGSVSERGFLMFGSKPIASVSKGVFEIEVDIYSKRLNWSSSGQFTLSDLQKTDAGAYTVDSNRGNVFSKYYDLRLYEPVSAPEVSCVNSSSVGLSLQCSVDKTEQISVSWLREGLTLGKSLSGVLSITVLLQDYNSTYTCVAENPADKNNITGDVFKLCNIAYTRMEEGETSDSTKYAYIIPIVLLALLCLGICFFMVKNKRKQTALQSQDSVQYAQITIKKRNGDQPQNSLAPSRSAPRPDLHTLYDEIQLHRITPTHSNSGAEIT